MRNASLTRIEVHLSRLRDLKMQNAIVTVADLTYLPAACCTLSSCIGDGGVEGQAKLFLLACGVSNDEAETARKFLNSRGASVEIVVIGADRLQAFRIDSYVSAATYAKLLLSDFFDDRWERLLYIDADTRVMVPLRTLLNTSLNGRPIGAVHDYLQYMAYGIEDARTRLGLRSDAPYFNAGIISFDWRATLASRMLQRAQSFAIENAQLCASHDQDALNKAFEGMWMPLDPRWNFMIVAVPREVLRLEYPARLRPYILHFAGPVKPWMTNFPEEYEAHRAWYRDLVRNSPWPHFATCSGPALGRISAASRTDRLKTWLLVQRRRFQRRLAEPTVMPRPVTEQSSTAVLKVCNVNPELERLLDQMVAEAGDLH